MADYTIIADTSSALLKMLRENLCPEPVISPESIVLVSPSDKNADYQLGLYLYDVKELSEYRTSAPIHTDNNTRQLPPRPLSLYYVLYMNSKAQITAVAEMEQRILGRAMQALSDNSTLDLDSTNPFLQSNESQTSITIINHGFEEKTKIWSALQSAYQVGVYFMVSPVLLSSRAQEKIVRVTQTQVQTQIVNNS